MGEVGAKHSKPEERRRADLGFMIGCIGVLTAITVCAVLSAGRGVFLPFFVAWILSYIMSPTVRYLSRFRVPPELSSVVLVALLIYVAVVAGGSFSQLLSGFVNKFPVYYDQLVIISGNFAEKFHISQTLFSGFNWGGTIRSFLLSLSGSLITVVSKTVMVLIFLLFILFGSPYMEYKIRRAFPRKSSQVLDILDSISKQIGSFLAVMTMISAATGLCIWVGLEAVGVDFAATWGVLAFALNFIPTVGSVLASIPPILVAIVQFYPAAETAALGIAPQVIITVIIIVATQLIIGNIITPKVMGDSMNLSPVVILVSLLLWTWIWGVMGALLSMPIAAIIKIVCDNVDELQMVGTLMGSGKTLKKDFEEARHAVLARQEKQ